VERSSPTQDKTLNEYQDMKRVIPQNITIVPLSNLLIIYHSSSPEAEIGDRVDQKVISLPKTTLSDAEYAVQGSFLAGASLKPW
jgi:hypothetical protein